jgi:hypothetical protein
MLAMEFPDQWRRFVSWAKHGTQKNFPSGRKPARHPVQAERSAQRIALEMATARVYIGSFHQGAEPGLHRWPGMAGAENKD